jgi:hypothetical protein
MGPVGLLKTRRIGGRRVGLGGRLRVVAPGEREKAEASEQEDE